MILRTRITASLVALLSTGVAYSQTPAQIEIFEKNARPLFADKCQGCHNEKLKSGGLDFSFCRWHQTSRRYRRFRNSIGSR